MPSFDGVGPRHRPLSITFGDDSELSEEDVRTFIDVYDHHGFPLNWEQGDVAVVCNYRFAHGRPNYTLEEGEKRELGVVLGAKYTRVGQVAGKW